MNAAFLIVKPPLHLFLQLINVRYKFLNNIGSLQQGDVDEAPSAAAVVDVDLRRPLPRRAMEVLREDVARRHNVVAVDYDGECVTLACEQPGDLLLADRLRSLLAKDVRLVYAPSGEIQQAIEANFGSSQPQKKSRRRTRQEYKAAAQMRSNAAHFDGVMALDDEEFGNDVVDSMLSEFTDTAIDFSESSRGRMGSRNSGDDREITNLLHSLENPRHPEPLSPPPRAGIDPIRSSGVSGMFFYTVEEGQRAIMRTPSGDIKILEGPVRVWAGSRRFELMQHYVAHPGEFLIVRYRDGGQEHHPGPASIWFDPRRHLEIVKQDALQISANEAVVVYSRPKDDTDVTRRLVRGPAMFVPEPGEWLHTFSWHASKGGSNGVQKIPNGLVFQKLWLLPDQMYHDIPDVRTSDDAVLTIRLMIFFELVDIEQMLDTTHDPIGDFVNAATSDVVEFTTRYDFEEFKKNTAQLNELDTYKQLTGRASQSGYRINKVVYRGYGAPDSLQHMQDQAIEARTRLQLERATENQSQELENYKLECQLSRSDKRRAEQALEATHELKLQEEREAAKLRQQQQARQHQREQLAADAEVTRQMTEQKNAQHLAELNRLNDMGVDLTAYLTHSRPDRVIELRGSEQPHIHLNGQDDAGFEPQ